MRIVYLLEHPGNGGAEEYAFNLASAARDANHEVIFILGDATGALVERVREANFDMLIIPMKSSFNVYEVTKGIFRLKKFIKEYKPDIVHTQMLREQSLVIGAKIFGAKTRLVRTIHRLDQFDSKMKPLMPLYRKYTDSYIAISDYVKEYLFANGIKGNVSMVHNGVHEVTPQSKKKGLGYIGRLTAEKGIKQFIEYNTEILRNNSLSVGGDGPEMNKLDKLVRENNLKTTLMGQITDKNLFFSNFNVLVLPSSTEALPLVVLESFSAGIPVVAFDLPSLRPLITEQNGALVKPGDYVGLAKAALALSESKEYLKYSKKAHDTYLENYTITKMWQQTSEIYDKIRADD